MTECKVCCRELPDPHHPCPRCGFRAPAVIGDEAAAEAFFDTLAAEHRNEFLKHFEFGIIIYYWKEQAGLAELDRKERLVFGSGDRLLEEPLWLEQKFARVPEETELAVELSVREAEKAPISIAVQLPVPAGDGPLEAGLLLTPQMTVSLQLRSSEGQTASAPVSFLQ